MQNTDVKHMQLSDGQTLAYRAAGETHGSVPLLFIHGLPDASDTWLPVIADVARKHRVYAADLAGYGHTDRPEIYDVSVAAQTHYLTEFLDRLDIEKVVLIGHDIGGGIAQIIAAKYPHRVTHLILINPIVDHYWPVLETRMLCVPLLAPFTLKVFETLMWKHIIKKGLSKPKTVTGTLIARYQQWYRGAQGRRRLIRNACALKNTDLRAWSAAIRAITTPTLLLWGREDRYLNVVPAQKLCREMQNCRFEFIDEAGHYVLDEQPKKVIAYIAEFLSTLGTANGE